MALFLKSSFSKLAAEFAGTFFFVFVSGCAVLSNVIFQEYGSIGIGLVTSAVLIGLMYAFSAVSGSHFNPVVTMALWFAQKISLVQASLYIITQILGGFAASMLLLLTFGQRGQDFYLGGPVISVDATLSSAILLEAIFAALWVLVYFATFVDKRGPVSFGALCVGMVVLAGTIVAWPITGAAFNPAKVIGPAVLSGNVNSLMVWIIGPLVGSLVGGFYNQVFLREPKKAGK